MWIILEGPDGAGKSTLAKELAEDIDGGINHLGPPKSATSALDECITGVPGGYRPGSGTELISDRHHWGCPVYGPVYRPNLDLDGFGDFGRTGFRYAEMFCMSRGAATFLITAPPEVIAGRVDDRGDDYINNADLPILHKGYEDLLPESATYALTIDTSAFPDGGSAGAREYIIDAALLREQEAAFLAPFPWYIGSTKPKIVVVCTPDRTERLKIIDAMGERWRDIGIASSAVAVPALEQLLEQSEASVCLAGKASAANLGHPDTWERLAFEELPHFT